MRDDETDAEASNRVSVEAALSSSLVAVRCANAALPTAHRLARMKQNARVLARRGLLRADVTVTRASQIMWAYSSPELYDLFVVRRGWTPQQLGEFVGNALAAAQLPMK